MLVIRKSALIIIFLLLLLPSLLTARSLFEVGLGVSGIYDTSHSNGGEKFFEGMGSPDNWTMGISVNARVSLVDLSLMALIPYTNDEGELFSLFSTLSLSIPLVNDSLYISVGGGLKGEFLSPADEPDSTYINGIAVEEATFEEVLLAAPLHAKIGLDLLIGNARIGVFYIMESLATVHKVGEAGGWVDLFRSTGKDKIGLSIQLALF